MARVTATIVIPTRSRPAKLRTCLEALCAQKGEHPFRVVVLDDAGFPPATGAAQDVCDRLHVELVCFSTRRGPARARNEGLRRANGGLAGFLDDDCVPAPDWVETAVRYFARHPEVDCIGGKITAVRPDLLLSRSRQRIYDERDAHYRNPDTSRAIAAGGRASPAGVLRSDYVSGGNFWLRGDRVAGLRFPENQGWGHDRSFARALLDQGRLIAYVPDLVVGHDHEHRFAHCAVRGFLHASNSEAARPNPGDPVEPLHLLRPAWCELLGRPAQGIPAADVGERLPARTVLALLTAVYGLGRLHGRLRSRQRVAG